MTGRALSEARASSEPIRARGGRDEGQLGLLLEAQLPNTETALETRSGATGPPSDPAGDRRPADHLHTHQGVVTARRALEAARARAGGTQKTARGQAPPLLLSQLPALERQVTLEDAPAYVCACVWLRLLTHWALLV